MILYMVSGSSIKEVESERQTEHSVFINGNRNAWKSMWSSYFESRKEAKDFIVNNLTNDLNRLKGQVSQIEDRLIKAKEL